MSTWAEQQAAELSLEQCVAQMIELRVSPQTFPIAQRLVGQYGLGAVSLCDLLTAETTAELMAGLRDHSSVPLLFACDCETGPSSPGTQYGTELPGSMALGATRDPEVAYQAGRIAGREASALGYHIIHGPILDVAQNPKNRFVNHRSFGGDVELVSALGTAFIRGCESEGVACAPEHFPGLGRAPLAARNQIPSVPAPETELRQVDLRPFAEAISQGLRLLSVGHIVAPALDGKPTQPSSLSRTIVTDLLRGSLGFQGLAASSPIDAECLAQKYSLEHRVMSAARAGIDLLAVDAPRSVPSVLGYLLAAIRSGEVSEEAARQSVRKILSLKEALCGIGAPAPAERKPRLRQDDALAMAETIAQRSVTVLTCAPDRLPLSPTEDDTILLATTLPPDEEDRAEALHAAMCTEVTRHHHSTIGLIVNLNATYEERNHVLLAADECQFVVIGVCSSSGPEGDLELTSALPALVTDLEDYGKRPILISCDNPHVLDSFPDAKTCLATYSASRPSMRAAINIIFGAAPPAGKLPLSLNTQYEYGQGLSSFSDGLS